MIKHTILLMAYAIPVTILVFVLCCLTVNVPYWDDYEVVFGWFVIPWPDRLLHLLDFHNEHRLMTARIVFEGVYRVLGHFDFQICMAVGAAFLLSYAMLIGRMMRPTGKYFHWTFLPCFWLIVSFIQYENLCWAMTAVSNFQVHFWALLALFAAMRCTQHQTELPIGAICATLATLSVGGGMAVWPCLVLTATVRRRKLSATVYALLGIVTIVLYLHNFPHADNCDEPFNIVNALLFFVSFCGAWIPYLPIALGVGTLTLGLLAYFASRVSKLNDFLPLSFATYLLGNMAAAALFRSNDGYDALSFRYILIPISLLACIVTLVAENLHWSDKVFKLLGCLFMVGAVVYSVGFLTIGGPLFANRNEILRHNILCWPKNPKGLRSCSPEIDSVLLEKCRDAGIYDPQCVRKASEQSPEILIPWLR